MHNKDMFRTASRSGLCFGIAQTANAILRLLFRGVSYPVSRKWDCFWAEQASWMMADTNERASKRAEGQAG
jgi:hypothetical protein